jgi:hypothetical protein
MTGINCPFLMLGFVTDATGGRSLWASLTGHSFHPPTQNHLA